RTVSSRVCATDKILAVIERGPLCAPGLNLGIGVLNDTNTMRGRTRIAADHERNASVLFRIGDGGFPVLLGLLQEHLLAIKIVSDYGLMVHHGREFDRRALRQSVHIDITEAVSLHKHGSGPFTFTSVAQKLVQSIRNSFVPRSGAASAC